MRRIRLGAQWNGTRGPRRKYGSCLQLRRAMMKIITVFLVSLLLTSIPSVGQVIGKGPVDWKGIQEAFAAYSQYPSDANATHVIDLLPESGHVESTSERKEHEGNRVRI
jgi:hypothetical protein